MAVVTPVGFATNIMLIKYMVNKRQFNVPNLPVGSMSLVSFILALVLLIFYRKDDRLDKSLLTIGPLGGIVNCLGILSVNRAVTLGPAGPVSALASTSTIMLTIV